MALLCSALGCAAQQGQSPVGPDRDEGAAASLPAVAAHRDHAASGRRGTAAPRSAATPYSGHTRQHLILSRVLRYAGGSANDAISALVSIGKLALMDSNQELVEQFVIAAHGNLGRVQELHSQHPEMLNSKWEKFDENALEAAGHMGRSDIAGYLLENGAPLTVYAAAMLGMEDRVAAYLQENPSLARTPGVHGFSALYHAALSGKVEIAELLLARGGDIGQDAALHAAAAGNHVPMATWLLARGANVQALNFEGKTPLQVARESGLQDMAALLAERSGTQ